nr:hypothetical protein BaRGS_025483 [Batillaria attramentaria]
MSFFMFHTASTYYARKRLADLAVEFELEKAPGIPELLSVIVNRDDVEAIIFKPGRRFMGPDGSNVAATQIQSSWRRYRDRSQYLEYRRLKWAAGVIAISWVMHIKMAQMRSQLRDTRARHLDNFRRRNKKFAASWDRIKKSKRVVIHIPSLGLNQKIRESISMSMRQNTQMARLCDIQDPNVDVIFVSPVPLSDETLQYYSKLLGLSSAVATGDVEEQCDMSDRYKILVPEAIKSFPAHRMCLATLLKYSPRTLKRISNLVRGRTAYIVTNIPHKDDVSVAEELDLPVLSPDPEMAGLYSTKSGCKRIFASANIDVPPGEYDIYSFQQLHECLAQLVTEYLSVKRWLFKLDDEFDGRGIAYCNITDHLKCFKWAQKEAFRYGDKWSKKWAQIVANSGRIGDFASVDPAVLNAMCKHIGTACKSRGIIGYVSISFVTFINSRTMEQIVWALDLRFHYSDSVAMFQLTRYVTNGNFNPSNHAFTISPPKTEKKQESMQRYCVVSTRLLHTNLAVVHYSVFFQMCRAHGIGYDIKEKQGTVFTLIDSFNRERLGMITVGDNLQGALATFARNLSVIHQEISAPNMQGISNFKGALEDIETILGTTLENADENPPEEELDQPPDVA